MKRDINKLDSGEQIELISKLKSRVQVLQQIGSHVQPIIQYVADNDFLIMSKEINKDVLFSLSRDESEIPVRIQFITEPSKPIPIEKIPTKIINQPKPFFKKVASGFLGFMGIFF